MADDRVFTLVGNFVDNITGPIQKINGSIDALKKNLGSFAGKKGSFSDLTQSMGKVIGAHKRLSEEVKTLRSELNASIPVLKEYRKEVGKTVSANMWLQGKGNKQRFNAKNNPTLQFLSAATRQTQELARASRGVQLGGRIPRGGGGGGGGGGGPRPPRPPSTARIPGGGGGGYVPSSRSSSTFGTKRFGVSRDETFAFGQTLGYTLGTTITGAVVQGFQIGVGLMVKPFQLFAGALQERVRDELSDISASGGLLSVSKRQKGTPLVKSFQDSMDLTQQTNKYMAEIAAALPGDTQQYIEVGKRLSDTAARMISADPAKAIAYAQELAAREGKGRIVETQKQAYTQIIGNMSTQGVLAGLGDGGAGGGSRGLMGAYGLPQLMERMMNDQEVSMGQFQRYAAIFRDPKIMEALERFIPKINATMKGTVDRARVFDKFFEEVLPPEMIRAFERSSAGIMEAFKTAFIGPETGLLGLGRKFENMGKKMDAYGRYLDENGDVTSFGNAVNASLSLFDMLRDIFANISISLYPLVDLLPQIFDPLKNIGDLLVDARHISGQFLQSFENYLAGLDQLAQTTKKGNEDFTKTKRARAGLLAITNFLTDVGAFSEAQFQSMRLEILDNPSAELGNILNGILTTFFESKAAYDLGNLIGTIIGTTLKQIATVIEYFLGVAKSSQLASGLKDGFYAAGGPEAFRSIIQNVFKALFKGILEIFKVAPLEFSIIGGAALLIPAFVSSFSILLANWLEGFLDGTLGTIGQKFKGLKGGLAARVAGSALALGGLGSGIKPNTKNIGISNVKMRPVGPRPPKGFEHIALPGSAPAIVGGVNAPGRAPAIPKAAALKKTSFGPLAKLKGKGVGLVAASMVTLSANAPELTKAAKAVGSFAKKIPGLAVAFAGLDFVFAKMAGKSTAEAGLSAGGGLAGGIAGAAIGQALIPIPGVGAVAGSMLGSVIGSWLGDQLAKIGPSIALGASSFESWIKTLPETVGGWLGVTYVKIENWFSTEIPKLGDWAKAQLATLKIKFDIGFNEFIEKSKVTLSDPAKWGKLVQSLVQGLINAINNVNPLTLVQAGFKAGTGIVQRVAEATKTGAAVERARTGVAPLMTESRARALTRYKGGLGDAIASEMRMKPPGSDLVIANSSETVIPAAGGHGMLDFVETLRSGFNAMILTYKAGQQKQESVLSSIRNTLVSNQQQTNIRLQKLETKFSAPSMGGLGGASIGGGVDSFTGMAQKYGLQMTSGYRPGDPGWHGANRARDYSNGTGPTPQMMQFAQFLASNYGSKLKELIYTPLGFSIKNGQKVAPYATAGHYNHVHVAYALGSGSPAFFSSQSAAESWERSMMQGSVKVRSVTGNSAEGFGGNTFGDINVTVNAGATSDPDTLASIVALKIGEAVADARSASIFV